MCTSTIRGFLTCGVIDSTTTNELLRVINWSGWSLPNDAGFSQVVPFVWAISTIRWCYMLVLPASCEIAPNAHTTHSLNICENPSRHCKWILRFSFLIRMSEGFPQLRAFFSSGLWRKMDSLLWQRDLRIWLFHKYEISQKITFGRKREMLLLFTFLHFFKCFLC